ncbi:MAG: serine hydrolase domain-containing protein [Acidobacteriota bacterium]
MKKILLCFLAAVVSIGLSLSAGEGPGVSGQSSPTGSDPQAIDTFVGGQVKNKGLVGISLAVMREGRIVLAKGYGQSSLKERQPVAPTTPFAIGSITKQFTCACIFLLAEEGKLSVKDHVAKYYPDLTRAKEITLLDLMNHVSGYPDYYPLDFVDRRMLRPVAVDEVIRSYAKAKLDFDPATRYSYSNTGYLILGRVVEKVSGEPFGRFLGRRILEPLRLHNTHFEPRPAGHDFARGHSTFALSPPEDAVPGASGWIAAAGALYSTPSDLARWDLALMEGKVLKPESYALMTTPRRLADGRASGYGCGLSVGERNGELVLSHNGAVSGFYALNTMVPSSRSAVVMLSNFDNYDAVNAVFTPVLRTLFPPEKAAPVEPARKEPPRSNAPSVAGPSAVEVAKAFFRRLQAADVDRSELGEEFSWFLTGAKISGASSRLKPYGDPADAEVQSIGERGGMEVSTVRLTFKSGVLRALMYRTPDGKIQQFFVSKS